jgi:ABC-type uncharacterized transport system fused permease/ATPase subunit
MAYLTGGKRETLGVECTSAVTADMERRLYKICLENAITYITIAHRPALRAFLHPLNCFASENIGSGISIG